MWKKLARFVLKYRLFLLLFLALITGIMGYFAQQVKLSYEFAKAIPTNNPKYQDYIDFRKTFGPDGNIMVVGIQTDSFYSTSFFNDYISLQNKLKGYNGVEGILSISSTIELQKDSATEKLKATPIFKNSYTIQSELDSAKSVFENMPFYKNRLYNPSSQVYLMAVSLNNDLMNSVKRIDAIKPIVELLNDFGKKHKTEMYLSGLPLLRTIISDRIKNEMGYFLTGSILLSAIILLIFFRSFSAMFISLVVVGIGVVFSMGSIVLLNYKISLLTALIPPLIVVIGIPNCIYFLNKYHTEYRATGDKQSSLLNMVSRMGIVTLFCNITAAIGFAVFALTYSPILKEFGVVAGINIMMLFFISILFLPAILSYLPVPKTRHIRYLENKRLNRWLVRIENWVFGHRKIVYSITVLILVFAFAGIYQLKSEGFIIDDLPKTDKLYTDLKFFEKHFNGVMPLEIVVDTKKKNNATRNLGNLLKVDSFVQYLGSRAEMAQPLTLTEGLKFVRQGYYGGDSSMYAMPDNFDLAFIAPYLNTKKDSNSKETPLAKALNSYVDSAKQKIRISVSMEDVGSYRLPKILDSVQQKANEIFDSSKFHVQYTGSSVTFLEGSRFIINGLKDSIIWAFALITLCMLYLFRSFRILLCSLIPNIIPLIITAGIMGWAGVALKPSTVLVFSVALGIAIDVTIRFLVNYKQELPANKGNITETIKQTIRHTGISIIYTSLVLIAGFIIFCVSNFGGTQSLGWLTSLTLLVAMVTNLVLLPVILISTQKSKLTKK